MTKLVRMLALLLAALPIAAQQHPNNARGFDPEKAYQTGDVDNVNVFNGNLIVTLPIGPRFPVSETLSYGLTLVYNGNPWDYRNDGINGGGEAAPSRFANAGLGWQLTLGELVGPNHPSAINLDRDGDWVYAAADGAERLFQRTLHTEEEGNANYEGTLAADTDPGDVVGYTRDSSYLRLVRLAPVRKFHGVNSQTFYFVPQYRIDFPDGTRHTFSGEEYETDTLDDNVNRLYEVDNWYRLTKIEDRSGNFVTVAYNGAVWTITDSRGRSHTVTTVRQNFYQFGSGPQQHNLVSSGSTISYTAGLRLFPTERQGTPRDQDGPDPHDISTAVRTRRVTNIDGTYAQWTYEPVQQNAGTYVDVDGITRTAHREMVVRVTDPLERTTAHYFNVNSLGLGASSCYLGDNAGDYGLPFSHTTGTEAGNGLFLSQVVYPARCVTWDNTSSCPVANPCLDANGLAVEAIRRVHLAYERDTPSSTASSRTSYNSRVSATRTTLLDDTGCGGVPCYTQSSSSGFDGLGHYRTETRSSNFPSTPQRAATTSYNANAAAGSYVPNGGSNPATYMLAGSAP